MQPKKEIRGIVRIAGQDLKGEMKLGRALSKIKGVGIRLASVLSEVIKNNLKLTDATVVGELNDDQIGEIEGILTNPGKYNIPPYMINRRKDYETGQNAHKIANDLTFSVKQDIERDKTIYTWRGYRHQYGQKVRGQHTRSTGRTGMTVGVLRKAILKAAGAAAPTAAQAQQAATTAATAAPAKQAAATPSPAKEEKKPAK